MLARWGLDASSAGSAHDAWRDAEGQRSPCHARNAGSRDWDGWRARRGRRAWRAWRVWHVWHVLRASGAHRGLGGPRARRVACG